MTDQRRVNWTISKAAYEHAAELSKRYGSLTKVVEVAIDRMYREEKTMKNNATRIITITDNANGMTYEIDLDEYRQAGGELPEDYGYENEGEDVAWVNVDYARQDDNWDVPEGWPEHLPLWEARV